MPSLGKVVGAVLIGIGVAMALFTFYVAYTRCFWYAVREQHANLALTFGKWGPALGFLCLMAAMGIALAKIGVDALRFAPPPVEQAPPAPASPLKPTPPMPGPVLAPSTTVSEAPKPSSPQPPSPPRAPAVGRRPSPLPRPATRPAAPSPPPETPPRPASEALRETFPPPPRIREEDLLPPPPGAREERPSPPGPPRREAGSMEIKLKEKTDLKTIIELLRRKRQERRRP